MESGRQNNKYNLVDVFAEVASNTPEDRRKFIGKFDQLVRHISVIPLPPTITIANTADTCDGVTEKIMAPPTTCIAQGGTCHEINHLVTLITENLLHCYRGNNDGKLENLLLNTIPWSTYLFVPFVSCHNINEPQQQQSTTQTTNHNNLNRLDPVIFANFYAEYVKIFPHKCSQLIDTFTPLFRGRRHRHHDAHHSQQSLEPSIIDEIEQSVFDQLHHTIRTLVKQVHIFESTLVRCVKKRTPYLHNTTTHEFICYYYNIITFAGYLSSDSASELLDHLFGQLLQLDILQHFIDLDAELNANKMINNDDDDDGDGDEAEEEEDEDEDELFQLDDSDLSRKNKKIKLIYIDEQDKELDERAKQLVILDSTLALLFRFIQDKVQLIQQLSNDKSSNVDECALNETRTTLNLFVSIFFQRILVANCSHLQYVIFYLATTYRPLCDTLVNTLWTLASSSDHQISCTVVNADSSIMPALVVRESAFAYLISFLANARVVNIQKTLFSFMQIMLQWLNAYIDQRPEPVMVMMANSGRKQQQQQQQQMPDNDVMYYQFCIGFCRLLVRFHEHLDHSQMAVLKSMNMKRVLISAPYSALQYFPVKLRDDFLLLATYYRIGYVSVHTLRHRTLASVSGAREHVSTFGSFWLPSIHRTLCGLLRDDDANGDDRVGLSRDGGDRKLWRGFQMFVYKLVQESEMANISKLVSKTPLMNKRKESNIITTTGTSDDGGGGYTSTGWLSSPSNSFIGGTSPMMKQHMINTAHSSSMLKKMLATDMDID